MTDVLTALVVRLKRRAIRAGAKGEVGLASDLRKAVALIEELSVLARPPGRLASLARRGSGHASDLDEAPDKARAAETTADAHEKRIQAKRDAIASASVRQSARRRIGIGERLTVGTAASDHRDGVAAAFQPQGSNCCGSSARNRRVIVPGAQST